MNRWVVGIGAWVASTGLMVTLWWVHTHGTWGVVLAAGLASAFTAAAVVAGAEVLIRLADITAALFDEKEEK